MARVTITLSDERYLALKQQAARRHQPIGHLIEESLDAFGIKSLSVTPTLVSNARRRSALREADSTRLAVREVRAARRG